MKKVNTVKARILTAIILSITFVVYPHLRVSAAEAVRAAARTEKRVSISG